MVKNGAQRPRVNRRLIKRDRIATIVIKQLLHNHNGEHIRVSEQHEYLSKATPRREQHWKNNWI